MNPQLIAVAGPLKGTVFDLIGEEISIGRDASNQVSLKDKSVSRRHSIIRIEQANFKLVDLQSRNGTFLDGVPVNEQALEHGSVIRIGDTFLLFLLHQDDHHGPVPNQVQLDDGTLITMSATRLRLEDSLYTMAHDLQVLMKVCTKINSINSQTTLQTELLKSLFDIVPAERGVILLTDDNLDTFSAFGIDRFGHTEPPIAVSRTVTQQVFNERVSLLSNELIDSHLLQSESLSSANVSSVLCVPLMLLNKPIGVIYLDATQAVAAFNQSHLQLVTAIAGVASGTLDRVRQTERLMEENQRLKTEEHIEHNMVGESAPMQEVYRLIAKVSQTDTTVLIQGESGTGKELAARAIHDNSLRADRPFVALNCAALPETLIESELFGHEKGAFTGATTQRKGKFELAVGGTLFLDEVGELSAAVQSKLLRVIQEKEFDRVGGTRSIKADVRLITATNKDLEKDASEGRFRKDLYYRLNVVTLTMPSLRNRTADIPLLSNYFVAKYSEKCKRHVRGLSDEARACMLKYDWPGNVRELENAIERAIVLGSTDRIRTEDLPEAIVDAMPEAKVSKSGTYHEALREAKKQIVIEALKVTDGNFKKAAAALDIHPNNLHRLIRNLDVRLR
jgi:transcriptional regulator with GAF, ATPase, and Fis domain